MGRINAVLLALLVAWSSTSATAAAQTAERDPEREALGRQIEQRFDVLPVQGGVVLRPKRQPRFPVRRADRRRDCD